MLSKDEQFQGALHKCWYLLLKKKSWFCFEIPSLGKLESQHMKVSRRTLEDVSVTGGYGECPLHLRELCAKWPLIDFLMWMSSFTPRGILSTDFKLIRFCNGAIRGFLLTCLICTYYRHEINNMNNFLRYITSLNTVG